MPWRHDMSINDAIDQETLNLKPIGEKPLKVVLDGEDFVISIDHENA
jgi:hypothetical protein